MCVSMIGTGLVWAYDCTNHDCTTHCMSGVGEGDQKQVCACVDRVKPSWYPLLQVSL